ncbi:lITAF domain-containing protein isoform X2 [Melopsittacus undulatus]|uniref:lITAF domain-containing protein isoform X2 n=1 Tax=Melopsittacus undulatus TaxID=13146 RepID=UPI00146AAD28|nr:LITAF domain-containing protein isoform X2 [Melopsittacus undulatus]
MPSEKARAEIPMIMYEPRPEPYAQEPSAPEYCSQEGGYEYPAPPPYSYRETATIEQPVTFMEVEKLKEDTEERLQRTVK